MDKGQRPGSEHPGKAALVFLRVTVKAGSKTLAHFLHCCLTMMRFSLFQIFLGSFTLQFCFWSSSWKLYLTPHCWVLICVSSCANHIFPTPSTCSQRWSCLPTNPNRPRKCLWYFPMQTHDCDSSVVVKAAENTDLQDRALQSIQTDPIHSLHLLKQLKINPGTKLFLFK